MWDAPRRQKERRWLNPLWFTHSDLGVGETNMVAKLYLILGIGCVSAATSLAASATRPVEPQQKEAQVVERLNKRRMQS